MVKNSLILFDCFGVILKPFLLEWFCRYFSKEKAYELFIYYANKGDLGEITLEECAIEMINKYDLKDLTVDKIINDWIEIARPNIELIRKVIDLRKNNKVALVSNAWIGCVERIFKHYDISMDIFDHCFISYQYKVKKPDLKFYQVALNYFKDYKFETIYMIDDNLTSMIGIEKMNINKIIFKDNSSIDVLLN